MTVSLYPDSLFNPLSFLSELLKKESVLIDLNSLQTFIILDKKGIKIDLSERLKAILTKNQLSLDIEEKEQKDEILKKTSNIKLLDQINLIKEVTSSIVSEKERLTVEKR